MGRISTYALLDKAEKAINSKHIEVIPVCNVRIRCLPNGEPAGVRIYESFPEYTRDITVIEISISADGKLIINNEFGTVFVKICDYFELFRLFAIMIKYTNVWDKRIKNGIFLRNIKNITYGGNGMYLVVKDKDIIGKYEDLDDAICQVCELLCSQGVSEDEIDDMVATSFEIAVGTHCDTSYGKSKIEIGDVILKVKDIMIVKEFKKSRK